MTTVFPEGMTDPDERDRWLEAPDTRSLDTARDSLDEAVMATIPRSHRDAVTEPTTKTAIEHRIAYDRLWFWQRAWRTLAGKRPDGLVDRHPTGVVHK